MNWLIQRLKEPSTWRGLAWMLTAFGISIKPDAWEYITVAGMAIAGLIGVITADEPPPIDLISRSNNRDRVGVLREADDVQSNPDDTKRWIDNKFPDGNG